MDCLEFLGVDHRYDGVFQLDVAAGITQGAWKLRGAGELGLSQAIESQHRLQEDWL